MDLLKGFGRNSIPLPTQEKHCEHDGLIKSLPSGYYWIRKQRSADDGCGKKK